MDNQTARFDFTRHQAGAELAPEHVEDFQRLVKDLRYGGTFQLLIVECIDWHLRENLIQRLNRILAELGHTAGRIELQREAYAEFAEVEAAIARLAETHHALHITGGENWFDDARLEAFNLRREAIAQAYPIRLLLWLDEDTVRRLAVKAPDWWAWRGGVFAFPTQPEAQAIEAPTPQLGPIDNRSLAKRSRRIAELRAYLKSNPPPPDEIAWSLWDELAELLVVMGQLDEALRIRVEEELSLYARLGDVRSMAVTFGQIADILQARGQLDEALRIRIKDQLPVFDRLGDVREKAMTLGKIADILQARGELNDALRIRLEEELPVYERLGDVREKAVTEGKIADILQTRGQFDEAQSLYAKLLSDFERLGDVRFKAVTQGKIADILLARGQLDEAQRIYSKEQLPVFERLGDVREKAGVLYKLAWVELRRGQHAKALAYLAEAYQIFEQAQIADGLVAVGDDFGEMLCKAGEQTRGLQVLETALQAAIQLDQTESIQRLRKRIEALRS